MGGSPDWQVIGDAVWISNKPKNTVFKLDPSTNKVAEAVTVGSKPCSGLAIGFGSLWVPNCGDKPVSRVDLKTNAVHGQFSQRYRKFGRLHCDRRGKRVAHDGRERDAGEDRSGYHKVIKEIALPAGSYCPIFGGGAIWVTSTDGNSVTRVDPATNAIVANDPVGKTPRFLAYGEGRRLDSEPGRW